MLHAFEHKPSVFTVFLVSFLGMSAVAFSSRSAAAVLTCNGDQTCSKLCAVAKIPQECADSWVAYKAAEQKRDALKAEYESALKAAFDQTVKTHGGQIAAAQADVEGLKFAEMNPEASALTEYLAALKTAIEKRPVNADQKHEGFFAELRKANEKSRSLNAATREIAVVFRNKLEERAKSVDAQLKIGISNVLAHLDADHAPGKFARALQAIDDADFPGRYADAEKDRSAKEKLAKAAGAIAEAPPAAPSDTSKPGKIKVLAAFYGKRYGVEEAVQLAKDSKFKPLGNNMPNHVCEATGVARKHCEFVSATLKICQDPATGKSQVQKTCSAPTVTDLGPTEVFAAIDLAMCAIPINPRVTCGGALPTTDGPRIAAVVYSCGSPKTATLVVEGPDMAELLVFCD